MEGVKLTYYTSKKFGLYFSISDLRYGISNGMTLGIGHGFQDSIWVNDGTNTTTDSTSTLDIGNSFIPKRMIVYGFGYDAKLFSYKEIFFINQSLGVNFGSCQLGYRSSVDDVNGNVFTSISQKGSVVESSPKVHNSSILFSLGAEYKVGKHLSLTFDWLLNQGFSTIIYDSENINYTKGNYIHSSTISRGSYWALNLGLKYYLKP